MASSKESAGEKGLPFGVDEIKKELKKKGKELNTLKLLGVLVEQNIKLAAEKRELAVQNSKLTAENVKRTAEKTELAAENVKLTAEKRELAAGKNGLQVENKSLQMQLDDIDKGRAKARKLGRVPDVNTFNTKQFPLPLKEQQALAEKLAAKIRAMRAMRHKARRKPGLLL